MSTTSEEILTHRTSSHAAHRPRAFRRACAAAFLLALAASSLSCSLAIDVSSKQCSVTADCTKLGDQFKNATCENSVCVVSSMSDPLMCATVLPTGSPTIKFTFTATVTGATPTDPFQITACGRPDATCTAPVFGPKAANNGELVELQLPTGFNGYLNIVNSAAVPAQLYLGQPLNQDTRGWDMTIPTVSTLKFLTSSVGHSYDATQGMVIAIARDCSRAALDHVSMTNSAGGTPFYFSGMLPYPNATETTTEGAGGFINVPLGTTILSAVHNPSMHKFQDVGALLLKGGITYMEIFP